MKIIFFSFSFLIFFSFQSFACSCWGPSSFCEYASQEPDRGPDLIIKGTKIRNVEHGMDFEISETFKGVEAKRVIRIWGDLGWLCRYYAGSFGDGEEYYFALYQIYEDTENPHAQTNPFSPLEKDGDYLISFCGKSYWHKSDEENRDEVDPIHCLNGLPPPPDQEINTNGNKDFCDIQKTELFPNPTGYKAYIRLAGNQELTKGTARIYDECGKLVYQLNDIKQFYNLGQFTFNVSSLSSGLYFLDINLPELCEWNLTRRLVVRD